MITKPSNRADPSEQRQTQQDISRSTDSINDQQWHMVSPIRGTRKGPTTPSHRREPGDGSQTNNKPLRITANNSGKNLLSISLVCLCYSHYSPSPLQCGSILTSDLFFSLDFYLSLFVFVSYQLLL